MLESREVATEMHATAETCSGLGVDEERLRIIRGAPSAKLRDSIVDAMKILGGESPLADVSSPLNDEEYLARVAIAALVLRERALSVRLDG